MSRADCGVGYWCNYTAGCGSPRTCQVRPACDDLGGSAPSCTCEDETVVVDVICPEVPTLAFFVTCEEACTTVSLTARVHPGPRALHEACPIGFRATGALPSRCCDCSLAGEAADRCANATTGDTLPTGCCRCVTPVSPDPTGRCRPPGGVFPPGASSWCCPIAEPVDSGAADGGP